MNNENNFPEYLKQLRIDAGYDRIEDLAKVSEISDASISRMENGKQRPLPKTLERLAPFLKVSFPELMEKSGYIKSNSLDHSGFFIDPSQLPLPIAIKEDMQLVMRIKNLSGNSKQLVIDLITTLESLESKCKGYCNR